jgi:neurotransmitter:Na+ symporter, NSS family
MQEKRASIHGLWSSRWAFVIAATGAAVGLGNIWKFPYIAGENGGGAFVLVYIICTLILGLPLMMAEILLGRYGRQNPANTIQSIAVEAHRSKYWALVGGLTVIVGPLILSYYSVIAGWALAYVFKSISGVFIHISIENTQALFKNFVTHPAKLIFWHSAMILISMIVVARGLEKGIEKTVRYLLPAMIILLVILIAYGAPSGFLDDTILFLFRPDFSRLTGQSVLIALGQAFFSLSIATGTIMMYGAYLPRYASVSSSAFMIVIADTAIALLAGLAIFPIVFANHLAPGAGPGLIFETLPLAFGRMPYGTIFATLFFIMLVFAALTSTISLLEPAVAWMMERKGFTRVRAASFVGFFVWLLGVGVCLSFNHWSKYTLFDRSLFESLDFLTANIMLPVGGILIAIFTVWRLPQSTLLQELQIKDNAFFHAWRFVLRFIVPPTIAIIFIHGLL